MVLKPNKPDALSLAREVLQWMAKHQVEIMLEEGVAKELDHPLFCLRSEMGGRIDFLIVLGGDGTLLSAVRDLGDRQVPILGVNLGGMGFLTEITLDELFQVLEQLLKGTLRTEMRKRLAVSVFHNGKKLCEYCVLNDGVITKGVLARIIHLRMSIDGHDVTTYHGDGVIISTPTGSTAYSLAAGGPIVYPTMDTILITPICPHTLTNRPLLIPDRARVEFTLESRESDVHLTLDGQVGCPLHPFDRVAITQAAHPVVFIKSPFKDYFEILRTKLKWGER
jgi:NAD+ kinase